MSFNKVVIIGAKGNLGQDLVKIFTKGKNYHLIAWDREEIDITNKKQLNKEINKIAPQLIINAAAYNAVDKCEEPKEFEMAKKINGDGVGYLAEIAEKLSAILVHYSSDNVFDGNKKEGYKEDDQPHPINRYGKTKYLGEILLKKIAKKYYLIRTSRLFGRPGCSKMSKESFIDLMLRLAREKEMLEIVNEEVACFTYTLDLAKATKDLIEKKKPFGVYHITNTGAYTWYEAALKIFQKEDIKIKIIPVLAEKFPRLSKRPKYSILLNTKLPPLRSFDKALEEYLGMYKLLNT